MCLLQKLLNGWKEHEIIYDTGADICVVKNDRYLLDMNTDSYARSRTEIVGVSGTRQADGIGIFPCFGHALLLNDCSINILSGIVAEKLYKVEHNVGKNYIIHISEELKLYFIKQTSGLYVCDLRIYFDALIIHQNKYENKDINNILVTTVR